MSAATSNTPRFSMPRLPLCDALYCRGNRLPPCQGSLRFLTLRRQPTFSCGCKLLLAWVLCLGRHRLGRVAESADPRCLPDHSRRHGLDAYYNYFQRSAWDPRGLARRVGVLLLTKLKFFGVITLLV